MPEQLMPNPWLSIITVCFNDAKNLQRTLNSIRNQHCNLIQSIVIDGGSTDHSLDIIHSNPDVITDWISEKDEGLYDAMNKGLTFVKGDYILFLNAGDVFHNDNVVHLTKASNEGEDVLYGDAIIVNEDGSFKSPLHKKTPHHLNWKSFKNGMVVCHQAIFVKFSISAQYNLKYKIAADIDWAIRTLKNSTSTRYLGFIVCDFQTGGLSSNRKILALLERWIILRRHFGILSTLYSHLRILYEFIQSRLKRLL